MHNFLCQNDPIFLLLSILLAKNNWHILAWGYWQILVWRYWSSLTQKNHKQKIGNNGKYFLNYTNFSCIIFCAELSRNSNLCTICLLPKVLTTGPSQFCVTNYPQLIYFCLSIYYSYYPNFTVKFKLQKAARMCQYYLLLCLNLTCEKTKNVPRPPPYLSPA